MLILAIDTSNQKTQLIILENDAELARMVIEDPSKQAERLIELVELVLSRASRHYDQLDALAVATGPGSFTGIRIGLAAVRGMALALDIPVIGVSLFDAALDELAARSVLPDGYSVAECMVAFDARRQQLYVAGASEGGDAPNGQLLCYDDFIKHIHALPTRPIICGSGVDSIKKLLVEHSFLFLTVDCFSYPDIQFIATNALKKWLNKPADIELPVPLYIRQPDAKPQIS